MAYEERHSVAISVSHRMLRYFYDGEARVSIEEQRPKLQDDRCLLDLLVHLIDRGGENASPEIP